MAHTTTASETKPPLRTLPEDWTSALAIVAHPDDMEYGAAAAVARWTSQGKTVHYVLASRGEAGIDGMRPDDVRPIRVAEQQAACDAVGVSSLEFLDHPDGVISDVMRLRREFAHAIRRLQPDVVITINHRDSFGPGTFNMADHRVVGLAVLDAVRDAANRWIFPDLVDADGRTLSPWPGVQFTAIAASPQPTHAVDVTDTVEAGIESLKAHTAYLAGLGKPGADPDSLGRSFVMRDADRFGGMPCTAFEVIGVPLE
ncbi:MAG: PIG-L deacetylase family protein [Nakamurella sp.]